MNLQQYVGLDLETAKRNAEQAGFEVSVEMSGPQAINCEYRQGRITFRVVQGIVVSAQLG